MANKLLIAPSILSADFSNLAREIKAVEDADADWIHIDVMDGRFVDNLTLGPPVISSLKKSCRVPLDVHLMIENPEKTYDRYIKAGASGITIHVEACPDPGKLLKDIKALGVRAGITLRPQTPIEKIEPFFPFADLVLIMTVNPGWGGQEFMTDQLDKIQRTKEWASENNPSLFIEVDGGINGKTARVCEKAGANVFVAGNAIFRSKDYAHAVKEIRGIS